MKRKYEQTYRAEWEQQPIFSSWLTKSKDGESAYCKACNCQVLPRMASLKEHSATTKHNRNMSGYKGTSQIDKYFKNTTISDEVKKAELKIIAAHLEHNIPFRTMDHLSDVYASAFHDSDIAKKFSCKRTKSAAIAYNVLGKSFQNKLVANIHEGGSFSIIIDESTDVSTTKILAIAIKFYSAESACVKTKFLSLVDIKGETAQDLFEALNGALIDSGLNLKNLIGFAADTTNVMFGEHGGVVAKIKEASPHCIFVKCICHSAALAVSHACKLLPRCIEQFVKEVHNYFAQSSKRHREFEAFQDFTNSEHHKILRHYDIRWLSLHACIHRILEQWNPLKLYFQGQYMEDGRQHVSLEFLFNTFNDNSLKLYLYFLDFILPIVNKFNVIFQGDYPVVHRVYEDIRGMYSSILTCYMKSAYVKSTDISDLDPMSSINFLNKGDMYLGINVAKHLANLKGTINREIIEDFFSRCQRFLVELSQQLKCRLPFQNPIFKELAFLEPQKAVYSEFSSLYSLLSKFPNLIPENTIQTIDNEYRELKVDNNIGNFLCCGSGSESTVNVETFWANVGRINDNANKKKFENLSKFANQMLCLPISNVKCERIFSDVNRIKTKDRNRFDNKNVSSIIYAKEGLQDIGKCPDFEPDANMIKAMDTKKLYKDINLNAE